MRVSDICTRHVFHVPSVTSIREAAEKMRKCHVGALVVVDNPNGQRKPVGIVTDRDIVVRACAAGKDLNSMTAKDVESEKLVTLDPSASSDEAVKLMRDNAVRRIPVVDHDKIVGIVSIGDLAQQHDPRSALGQISKASPNN